MKLGTSIVFTIFRFLEKNLFSRLRRGYHKANLPKFAFLGQATVINSPFYSGNAQWISIGHLCHIGRECDFGVVNTPAQDGSNALRGYITLGNRVRITKALQLYSAKSISIDDDVLIASNVFMCDCSHGYSRGDVPYSQQHFMNEAPIHICRGVWIGQNVVILAGVIIGEYAIVGANSVVTHSIPARSISVGSPARPISLWSEENKTWNRLI